MSQKLISAQPSADPKCTRVKWPRTKILHKYIFHDIDIDCDNLYLHDTCKNLLCYIFLCFFISTLEVTLVSFACLFFSICFQMPPQIPCLRGRIITFIAFILTGLRCAFSNVSSKHLPMKMHSRTGYICLTLLQCVLSNVPSNYLPQRMQNCTGCIYLPFLQCEFSNVSSKCLHERM